MDSSLLFITHPGNELKIATVQFDTPLPPPFTPSYITNLLPPPFIPTPFYNVTNLDLLSLNKKQEFELWNQSNL